MPADTRTARQVLVLPKATPKAALGIHFVNGKNVRAPASTSVGDHLSPSQPCSSIATRRPRNRTPSISSRMRRVAMEEHGWEGLR